MLAAPGYLVLDALFAPYIIDLDPDPPVDWLVIRTIREALELAPWFIAAWLLINLPVLLLPAPSSIRLEDAVEHDSGSDASVHADSTTVLGNLRDVSAELGDAGMQVHRSHWVANTHVRRIVGNASDAACIMSNELRVPVSRRHWKEVREQFGRGVVHASEFVENKHMNHS